MVIAMILLYISPFNPQNHLMAIEVGKMVRTTHYNHQNRLGGDGCSDGFQIHISMQPSESSGGGGCIAMVLDYTSPCNHQNRLVVEVA